MTKPRLRVLGDSEAAVPARGRDVTAYATLFKALGDPTRLEIVSLLVAVRSPLEASEIAARFDLAPATISQHLQHLRRAGVLTAERRGRSTWYALRVIALGRIEGFTKVLGAR